jgi:predicted dehydrogenase
VLHGGALGELWGVESRMDQDNAATLEVGPDAGLLRDLGSHLVDQMLWLLGSARTVYAELDHVDAEGGPTDCRFSLSLTHAAGVHSRVSASKINHIEDRELRAYGSGGSYLARGTDVQAQAIFAGRRPVDEGDGWGYDAPEHWGTLHTTAGSVQVPSEQGAYHDYYSRFAAALRGDGDFPVPAEQAVRTLEVLDAARVSAAENRVVDLPQS